MTSITVTQQGALAVAHEKAAMSENDAAIEVVNLVKRYPKAKSNAVDGISFGVQRGEIFGLLGPNGAGKTTTISILTTGAKPTSGTVRIMGIDVVGNPVRSRQRLALVPQKSNLDKRLRARELLLFHASYHAVPRALREARADALLAEFGLAERAKDNVNHFSGGMAQRLMLARALMHTPDVLVLDEPTNSLDPQSRLFLWDRIHWLHAQGMTILLPTHDMDEAEHLCDRIAIMDQGRILELDTMDALQKLVPGGTRLELRIRMPEIASPQTASRDAQTGVSSPSPVLEALRALPGVAKVEELAPADGEEGQQDTILYRLYAEDIEALAADVIQAVSSAGATLRTINITRPGLEDVFITLTGRNLRS